jgi:uncharacterized protein (TIGR02284 family)
LRHIFADRVYRCRRSFRTEIRDLGGKPEDDGTILASVQRPFVNLKNRVTGSGQGIVNEVEAGEDHSRASSRRSCAEKISQLR